MKSEMNKMEVTGKQNGAWSDVVFVLWAGGMALLSYSLVYALRKPFTAATFEGLDFSAWTTRRLPVSCRLRDISCPS